MQAYDLIMLIVLGMSTIFGAIKGLAWQVASLASIIVSYIVAYRYRFQVAEMIEAKPPWNMFLAMLILYVGTGFVIWVGFRLMSGVIDKIRLKDFDRHLGALFGFGKGLIFCLLITMFAMTLLGPVQQAAICQSRSGFFITTALDKGAGVLPREIHDVVGPYLANLEDQLRQQRQQQQQQNQEQQLEGWPDVPGINQPNFNPSALNPSALNPSNFSPNAGFPGLGGVLDGSRSNGAGIVNVNPPPNNQAYQQQPNQRQPAGNNQAWPYGQIPSGQFPNGQPATNNYPSGLRASDSNNQQAQQPDWILPR